MQGFRRAGAWFRRRWWLVLIALVLFVSLIDDKPQWYLDEAAVMEEIANVVDSPVPYERIEGWSWARHVSRVVLPRADLDDEEIHRLTSLLRKLPRLTDVTCYYVREQKHQVEQLRRELRGHATVGTGLWASSEDDESRQERTYVAGIHRPDLHKRKARRSHSRFERFLSTRSFRWATNLPVDLRELNGLAEEAWALAHRWLGVSEDDLPAPALPIYLCANTAELQAVEFEYGLVGSSFRERSDAGGFYRAGPVVAVIATADLAPEHAVHEVVHAVVARVLPQCPRPLNEGAAMLLTERLLGEKARYGTWTVEYATARRRGCAAQDVDQLSLRALFSLGYRDFCDTRHGRNYWLSLELVRVLDRENAARFSGGLQRFVRTLSGRRGADAFEILAEVYPVHELEGLWKEQLRRAARGTEPR